jgi:hypothetical protein
MQTYPQVCGLRVNIQVDHFRSRDPRIEGPPLVAFGINHTTLFQHCRHPGGLCGDTRRV